MCLSILKHNDEKRIIASTAKNNIPCYKIINLNLKSLYFSYPYTFNKLERNNLFPEIIQDDYYCDWFEVGCYAFHSYDSLSSLKSFLIKSPNVSGFIAECTIPEGSLYYKGFHEDEIITGYASNQIVLEKITQGLNISLSSYSKIELL